MLDMERIGKMLRELRQAENMTQEELADSLYLSHQAVSKWEIGKMLPSIDTLVELSRIFKVPVEHILCIDVSPTIKDVEDLFASHTRQWAIHEATMDHSGKVKLQDIIHLLDTEERSYALRVMTDAKIPMGQELWPRLSLDERAWILNQYIKNGYPLQECNIRNQMTYAERKRIREGIK